ncbi:MAG: clan AA aspartic protease [Chloroflexota bacterium]|nr:clan AA aspartic protease [Chloroflexota bacterium]MDE2895368.1 clan AA aspartic protease [Chloroflexota bacterium]
MLRIAPKPEAVAQLTRILEETPVGLTYVPVTVINPAEPDRTWRADFLVDTGSMSCVVPESALLSIGIMPRAATDIYLFDGSSQRRFVADAQFELLDDSASSRVIFGEDGEEPIIGLTILESLGLIVDPFAEQLHKRSPTRNGAS